MKERGAAPAQARAGRALLCDLGNGSLKLGLLLAGEAREVRGLAAISDREDGWKAELAIVLDDSGACGLPVFVSSVAQTGRGENLRSALEQSGAGKILWHPHPGLTLDVRHPETVGLDRLYAARAAWELVAHRPVICVDVGTAMTVDAVVPGPDGTATFLGGAIAPGPALLAKALGAGGAQLSQVDAKPGAPALGKETKEALEAGISVGLAGSAMHLVRSVAKEADLLAPAVCLTGGAAPFVLPVLRSLGWGCVQDAHLVLKGLAWAGLEHSAEQAGDHGI